MAINLDMTKEEWNVFLRNAKQDSFSRDDIQALLNCDKYIVFPTYYAEDDMWNTTICYPYSMDADRSDLSETYITCEVYMRADKSNGMWYDTLSYDEEDYSDDVCYAYSEKVDSYYPFILADAKTGEVLGFLPLAGEKIKDIQQLCEDDIVYKVDSPQAKTAYFNVLTSSEVLVEGYCAADERSTEIIQQNEGITGTYEVCYGPDVVSSYPAYSDYTVEFKNIYGEELGDDDFFEQVKESAYSTLDTDEAKKSIKDSVNYYKISGNAYKAEKAKDDTIKLVDTRNKAKTVERID